MHYKFKINGDIDMEMLDLWLNLPLNEIESVSTG